jgi:hypothetical protein
MTFNVNATSVEYTLKTQLLPTGFHIGNGDMPSYVQTNL